MTARRGRGAGTKQHALVVRWRGPVPLRRIRGPRHAQLAVVADPLPAHDSGPAHLPFDFCTRVRRLLEDITRRCGELAHIQVPRILLAVTQARSARAHGLQARITPLRFRHGALTRQRRGVIYQVQRYFVDDHEFLYLLTFCLPRFLDQTFDEKLVTLLHELYHISPAFDGDLRRHDGRYQLHTHSQRHYDCRMGELARAYLATHPDPALHGFLRLNFAQLQKRHGCVLGARVPRPMMVPLLSSAAQFRPGETGR